MTDAELKALVASNAQAISKLAAFQENESQQWRARIERENAEWKAGIEDTIKLVSQGITLQENESQQWRARIERENAEWKAGIEDTVKLVSQGITDLGEKIDRLIQALTGVRPNGKGKT